MHVLGLDTSTRRQSVAVVQDGRLVAEASGEISTTHSESLMSAIAAALDAAGVGPKGLAAVAVTSGPGSFTGIRIGMATAKGLSLAAGVPLAGFSTLHALAEALAESAPAAHLYVPLMDAGRGQIYRALYEREGDPSGVLRTRPVAAETIVDPASAFDGVGEGAAVGGDGLARYRDALEPRLPSGSILVTTALLLAPFVARRAGRLAAEGRLGDHPLVPNYVRPPDALRGPPGSWPRA
jgi:tRNA threonylcarbamoyladenosine biosynthesis protein TsaB